MGSLGFSLTLFTLELAALFHHGWNSPGSQLPTKACQGDGKYEEKSIFLAEFEIPRLSLFTRQTNGAEWCSSSDFSEDHFCGISDEWKQNSSSRFEHTCLQDCVSLASESWISTSVLYRSFYHRIHILWGKNQLLSNFPFCFILFLAPLAIRYEVWKVATNCSSLCHKDAI